MSKIIVIIVRNINYFLKVNTIIKLFTKTIINIMVIIIFNVKEN